MRHKALTPNSVIRNSAGFLTADFLFAIIIASGLCMVFFCLTFTLSMVEVGQYIAFSVSRAHSAGHKTQDDQIAMAKSKFAALQKNKVLRPLFSNGWFEITNLDVRSGGVTGKDFSDRYPRGPASEPFIPQVGVRLNFEAKMLSAQVPMLGKTDSGNGFKAFLTGMLIREPSSEECFNQIRKERYKAILKLDKDNRFEKIAGSGSEKDYVPMEDNGC
jgi:hypothetical protein